MAVKPYQADLTPIGHFDFLDSELTGIQGGEVVVFDEIDTALTQDQSAPDVFSDGPTRTLLRLATGADTGPFFIANVPDGTTFSAPGFETTSMYSQNQTFNQTLDSSSKIGIYGQEAFYVVNSSVVDTTTINQYTPVGSRLYVNSEGHITTKHSAAGAIVGFFVEWQSGDLLRGFPDKFYRNTRHKSGDSIIIYKANGDGYVSSIIFNELSSKISFNDLLDVNITSPNDGYFVVYNGSTGQWKQSPIYFNDLLDVNVSPPLDGYFVAYNGSTEQWEQTISPSARMEYIQVNSSYSASINDTFIAVDASSGPVTITFPPAVSLKGKKYHVKKIDNTANGITVVPSGSNLIDSNPSLFFNSPNDGFIFVGDGSNNWWIT